MACDTSEFYEELEAELRRELEWGLEVLIDLVLGHQRRKEE